jgi:subtilisin-like proprotein convertase family protein
MKPLHTLLATLLFASATTQGGLYPSDTLNTTIPDANPTGISSTLNVSGMGSVLSDVNVLLNVSGGANGDLYAYLSYNGILVPLLNRVGTGTGGAIQQIYGFSTAGFSNVKLDDAATGGSIHDVATPGSSPTFSYTPDGGSLSSFNGSNPNGNWTLFFADMASGGGSSPSTLTSWSLEITAVPEPVNVALGVFGGVLLLIGLVRSRRVRSRVQRCRDAFVVWVNAV